MFLVQAGYDTYEKIFFCFLTHTHALLALACSLLAPCVACRVSCVGTRTGRAGTIPMYVGAVGPQLNDRWPEPSIDRV